MTRKDKSDLPKKTTWHMSFNRDNSYDKIILDYFESLDTSLSITTAVKEFLYLSITNKKAIIFNENQQVKTIEDKIVNEKLDLIINKLNEIEKNKNENIKKPNDIKVAIENFENSLL